MARKRVDDKHSLALIFLVAAVAVAGLHSMSTNQTPTEEFVIVEYLDDISEDQMAAFTGNVVAEEPKIRKLIVNEPPSKENYRKKYGCYKRCHCSYADTCQCEYGGCIRVNEGGPKVKKDVSHGTYVRSSEKRYEDREQRRIYQGPNPR